MTPTALELNALGDRVSSIAFRLEHLDQDTDTTEWLVLELQRVALDIYRQAMASGARPDTPGATTGAPHAAVLEAGPPARDALPDVSAAGSASTFAEGQA